MSWMPDPVFMFKVLRHSIEYMNRPWKQDYEGMKQYQAHALRKMMRYARRVPLYREKHENAGINAASINSIDDVEKLPFVTKDDLRRYGPSGTTPDGFNREYAWKVDTSGTTGEPVSIFRDVNALAIESTMVSRMLKAYNLNLFKTRITNIGDFGLPGSYDEEVLQQGVYKKMGFLHSSHRLQSVFAGKDIREIMSDLETFNPELIIAYPGNLIGLMELRKEGNGESLDPEYIVSSGGVMGDYMKKQIENAFDAPVLDLYAATEGGTLAFECLNGGYHIQSDYVHIEAVNANKEHVPPGENGHVMVNRLYGGGTPILRYTGMNDFVTLSDEHCDCGMHTPLLEKVEGRSADSIVLPDGRIIPPATFTLIPGEVAQEYGVDKIQRFQIIQHKKDKIEILIVINEEYREAEPSVDTLISEIKQRYQQLVGEKVALEAKEVKQVKKDPDAPPESPYPIIISHLDHEQWI